MTARSGVCRVRAVVAAGLLAACATSAPLNAQDQTIEGVAGGLMAGGIGPDGQLPCLTGAGKPAPCGSPDHIARVQRDLQAIGIDPGPLDGIPGQKTQNAVRQFLDLAGRPQAGMLTSRDDTLLRQYVLVRGADRTALDPADLQEFAQRAQSYGLDSLWGQTVVLANGVAATPSTTPLPTRVFAGPGQFPPTGFRGYGFVAFKSTASDFDLNRHQIICQAYLNSMQATGVAAAPRGDQFVTVWPVGDIPTALALNLQNSRVQSGDVCNRAINAYDVAQANAAMAAALQGGAVLDGVGPFLFGWVPAATYGTADPLILMVDLSRVETYDKALALFESWKDRIETDPALLRDGFSAEWVRLAIRDWADQHGDILLLLIGG